MFLFLFEFPTLSKFLIQNFKKSGNFKIILPNSVPYHINPVFYYILQSKKQLKFFNRETLMIITNIRFIDFFWKENPFFDSSVSWTHQKTEVMHYS